MNEVMKTVNDQFNSMFVSGNCCEQLINREIMQAYGDSIVSHVDFVHGMQDARDGVKHEIGMPIDYDRGYAAIKEQEAIIGHRYAAL